MRETIQDFINRRRAGERQSKVVGDADLLSLFMANPKEFSDEVIVDELMDFFVAGAQTTQLTTETIVGHFATNLESLSEVRAEFKECIGSQNQRSDKHESLAAYLKETVTLSDCQELDYLNMVINEALRVSPPVPCSSFYTVSEDTTLGNTKFRKGDSLIVNFTGLHTNASEWQRPNEFLPRRFD